jgi:hypothetical protein
MVVPAKLRPGGQAVICTEDQIRNRVPPSPTGEWGQPEFQLPIRPFISRYLRAVEFGYGFRPNASAGLVFVMRLISATEIPSLCSASMKSSKP